jgi:hypothetical protein
VDRSDDMRVFAKVVECSSFAGAAARLSIAATKPAPPSVIATAAWRRGIRMRPVGARHRMRPAETEDIVLPRLKNRSTARRVAQSRRQWRRRGMRRSIVRPKKARRRGADGSQKPSFSRGIRLERSS